MNDIRKEIGKLLKSKFGDELGKTLEKYYEDTDPSEVIELARHMLSSLIGEEMANDLINRILKNYPDYKKLIIVGS